jgi:hypothetical protein
MVPLESAQQSPFDTCHSITSGYFMQMACPAQHRSLTMDKAREMNYNL